MHQRNSWPALPYEAWRDTCNNRTLRDLLEESPLEAVKKDDALAGERHLRQQN